MIFKGSIVASITPFLNGEVDENAVHNIINFHVRSNTQGFVACGSTGEAALLTRAEWELMLRTCIRASAGRLPIIAGCGTPSTAETIALVQRAEELGADAALIVTPFYVRPNATGIIKHFEQIQDVCDLPLIVYNNPGRAGVDLSVDTIIELSKMPTVIGLKDSNTDLNRLIHLRQAIEKPFSFLSGDDATTAAYLACGGHGAISVTANAAPKLMQELCDAWAHQDLETFTERRDRLAHLHAVLMRETNPTPAKFAVSCLGLCKNELRMPLIPVTSETEQMIQETLEQVLGLPLVA